MKKVKLLHNPTAGDTDFSRKELVRLIEKEGFECEYASVKEKGWNHFDNETDFLVIAGGDGTVRRVSKALMGRKRLDKQFPVGLLPHGTANNIACALGIDGSVSDIVAGWHADQLKPFDIGKVYGQAEDLFFLEGFGFGIFPRLMKVMNRIEEEIGDSTAEKIRAARAMLYDIVLDYEAKDCTIVADGADHSGKYLLVELMNIRSIGPNLILSSHADPGDGELDLVLIPESDREKFGKYLLGLINGRDEIYHFSAIRTRNLEITWHGKDAHADDERIKLERSAQVKIEIQPSMLEFLIPA